MAQRRPGKRRRVRIDEALTLFFDSWPYEGPRIPAVQTVRTYRSHLEWFATFAAGERRYYIEDIGPKLLREALRTLLTAKTSRRAANFKGGEAAANGLIWAVRAFIRWLTANNVAVADISTVRTPQVPRRIQPRLYPGEFDALEHAILRRLVDSSRRLPRFVVARDLALIYLLYDTGLRANEVCSMTLADVDQSAGRITVRRGKGGKQRIITIRDSTQPGGGETLRRLAEWIDTRSTIDRCSRHDMLWVSVRASPLTTDQLRYVLSQICEAAGLDGNRPPHAFRRTSFTEHYHANPAELDTLVARMGWSNSSREMIDTYVRGAEVDLAATREMPSLAGQRRNVRLLEQRQTATRGFPSTGTTPAVAANHPPQGRRSLAQ